MLFFCFQLSSNNDDLQSLLNSSQANQEQLKTRVIAVKLRGNYFYLLRFSIAGMVTNYCEPLTVSPPIRDEPPHPGLLSLLFTNSVWVSSASRGIYMCEGCLIGPMVYYRYPRRLEKFNHYFASFPCMHNFGERTRQVSKTIPVMYQGCY